MWDEKRINRPTYQKVKSTYNLQWDVCIGAEVGDGEESNIIFDQEQIGDDIEDICEERYPPDSEIKMDDMASIREEYEYVRPVILLYGSDEVIIITNEGDARASL